MDEIQTWIEDRYGPITTQSVISPIVSICCAVVPVMGGVSIGMGLTEQLAIHDLYLSLTHSPTLKTALEGAWLDRRRRLNASDMGCACICLEAIRSH